MGTVAVARAGPDDHHRLLDDLPRGAPELHLDGFGVVRGAAPAVAADPAEPGPVGLQARAVLELQVGGFHRLHGAETLLSFLRKKKRTEAWNGYHSSMGPFEGYGIAC